MAEVRRLADPLVPALSDLEPFARHLPAGMRSLRGFLPTARGLLVDLGSLARDGRAPAADLRAAFAALGPASGGLTPSVEKLLPVLRQVDRNKTGVGLLGERFSGVFSTQDSNGPILRGLGFFEEFRPFLLGFEDGIKGAELARAQRMAIKALTLVCKDGNDVACLTRYLVPGLPGAVKPGQSAPRLASQPVTTQPPQPLRAAPGQPPELRRTLAAALAAASKGTP